MGAHLMKASRDELVQAHKGVGVEAARVRVVIGGGVEGVPFFHHEEREGKEARSLAVAGLWVGGAHAILRAASRRRWRQ